ncbi:magnesium transporter [Mycolicibacterium sp.]|uniref:magnesium transporter n=1 Tax=Mycolicibacterium sp. TaxID=2320850 RepID=UPI0025E99C2C|nr:magnesium transporter [Mycolicibacterium sp.]
MLSPVLLLSRVTGRDVVGPDGRGVGRLADLTVRVDGDHPVVNRLLVTRRGGPTLLVPWAAVGDFDGPVVLEDATGFEVPALAEALGPDELLLVRDVLDTQVVDVVGQRLARVADVLLSRDGDGPLVLAGVEVGFGGVIRRLGLGTGLVARDVVDWSDLHLASDRGHSVQLSAPRSAVHRLDPHGLAAVISRVDVDAATEILASADPQTAAEAVRVVHPEVAERLHRREPLLGRRFFRSGVWPHRRRLSRRARR